MPSMGTQHGIPGLALAFLAGWAAAHWLAPDLLASYLNGQGTCN